jgi:Fe-S-cluster containining protein
MSSQPEGPNLLERFFIELGRTIKAAAGETMSARKNPDGLARTVDAAMSAFDDAVKGLERWVPPKEPLDCRAGCSYCCHLTVLTDPLTVLRIGRFVAESFDEAARNRLKARIAERQRRHAGLGQKERRERRDPCPLLEDGRCTVYPVRPLSCRAFNSVDVGACEREIFEGGKPELVDSWNIPWLAALAVSEGMATGLIEAGYVDGELELTTALAIALEWPNAAERWLAGEPIFTRARWLLELG